MLRVNDLQVYYGGIHALRGISLRAPEGRIVTLIGANGAGKTTTLRAVTGLVKPRSGSVRLGGEELTRLDPFRIIRKGIGVSPEGRRVFPNLTVLENLELGAYYRTSREVSAELKRVYSLFPRLEERQRQKAGTLSGGEQQMVALGRALMSRPRLLLLDEPSLGLAPLMVEEVLEAVQRMNREGATILLIEQNAMAALRVAHYGYVIETGRIVLEGEARDLLEDQRVRRAYLGEG